MDYLELPASPVKADFEDNLVTTALDQPEVDDCFAALSFRRIKAQLPESHLTTCGIAPEKKDVRSDSSRLLVVYFDQ